MKKNNCGGVAGSERGAGSSLIGLPRGERGALTGHVDVVVGRTGPAPGLAAHQIREERETERHRERKRKRDS
jgi:hypothetical protein